MAGGCGARLSAGFGLVVCMVGAALGFVNYRDGASPAQDAVFIGMVVAGLIIMLASAVQPSISVSGRRRDRNAPMVDVASFVAPPGEMAEGYCWQCGKRVRQGRRICPACGATQMSPNQTSSSFSPPPGWQRPPTPASQDPWAALPPQARGPSPAPIAQFPRPQEPARRSAPSYVPGASQYIPSQGMPVEEDIEPGPSRRQRRNVRSISREPEPPGWDDPIDGW